MKVQLVALPYLADADRDALTAHIRDVVLQRMLPFVALEPRAGLAANFVSEWNAGTGDDQQLLPATIKLTEAELAPHQRLSFTFDMDALYFGLFGELLTKGIRGRVVVKDDTFSDSIAVNLRLDAMVTNALQVEATGFGAAAMPEDPGPGADGDTSGAEPAKKTLRLRNGLRYPAALARLQVTCIDRGQVPGMIFDAEPLELLAATQKLAGGDDPAASAEYEVHPQRIAVWNDTTVTVGAITVDAGTPKEWLDRISRDPSLTPQRHVVKVLPVVPAGAAVQLVRLKLFAEGAGTLLQSQDILPTGPSDLTIEVRLADLAAAGAQPPSFALEYDCEYADGTLSLPQRVPVSPTVESMPISVLFEKPDSVFSVEHGVAGAAPTTESKLSRDAATDIVNQARTRGERWRVFARTP